MIGAITSQSNVYNLATMQRADSADRSGEVATGAAGRPHRGGPPPGLPPEAVSSAAETLGMSESDLVEALQSGSTLKELAAAKGVSDSDLVTAVVEGLKSGAAERAAATGSTLPQLSDEQLIEIATHLVNGERPPFRVPESTTDTSDATAIDLIASVLRELGTNAGLELGSTETSPTTSSVQAAYSAFSTTNDSEALSSLLQLTI